MMTKAFIFLNGEFSPNVNFYKNLDISNLFCADGGAKKAIELGLTPLEVWGDFDSLDQNHISWLKEKNVKFNTFDKHKDFTDGELLIAYVSSLGYDKIYVLGGTGNRTDHMLTNLNLIFKYNNLIFKNEREEIFSVNKQFDFTNLKSYTVSFIPFSDEVANLNLIGFKYPLKNFNLKRGASICMSNIIEYDHAHVSFSSGKLICIINF